MINFTILEDSKFGDKCVGKVDINMERLLDLHRMQPNEGEYPIFYERCYD